MASIGDKTLKSYYLITAFLMGSLLFYSCGTSNFAKRKYTKGVYIEKRGHASSKKQKDFAGKNEIATTRSKNKSHKKVASIETQKNLEINQESNRTKSEENKTKKNKTTDSEITDITEDPHELIEEPITEITVDKESSSTDQKETKRTGLAVLILGIVALALIGLGYGLAILLWSEMVLTVIFIISIIVGSIGAIMGVISLTDAREELDGNRTMAIVGLVLSILAILISILLLVFL